MGEKSQSPQRSLPLGQVPPQAISGVKKPGTKNSVVVPVAMLVSFSALTILSLSPVGWGGSSSQGRRGQQKERRSMGDESVVKAVLPEGENVTEQRDGKSTSSRGLTSPLDLDTTTAVTMSPLKNDGNVMANVPETLLLPESSALDFFLREGRRHKSSTISPATWPGLSTRKNSSSLSTYQHQRKWGEGNKPQCQDNVHCPLHEGCVADELGVCYEAPVDLLAHDLYGEPALLSSFPSVSNLPNSSRGNPHSTVAREELSCNWMPSKPDPLPPLILNDTASPEGLVRAFKHLTGSFFSKWYDWPAEIKQVKDLPGGTFVMHGSHEGPDQLYTIRNFCLTIAGGLTGYQPDTSNYKGGNEFVAGLLLRKSTEKPSSFARNLYDPHVKAFHHWLNVRLPPTVTHRKGSKIRSLSTQPTWYVDRKIAVMPMIEYFHPGHLLMRMGALVSNVEGGFPRRGHNGSTIETEKPSPSASTVTPPGGGKEEAQQREEEEEKKNRGSRSQADYGQGAREDVTTLFVSFPKNCPPPCTFKQSNYGLYTTLATTSHFTTYAAGSVNDGIRVWLKTTREGRVFASAPNFIRRLTQLTALLSQPICFREAVFYQSCHLDDCKKTTEPSRAAWPSTGVRNPATQKALAERFRQCVGVTPTRTTTTARPSPTVLFSYRANSKRIIGQSSLVPLLHKWLLEVGGPDSRLVVAEFKRLSFHKLVRLYSSVDMIFGTYGTGFMYGFLMQPGPASSVGVEISSSVGFFKREVGGLNRNSLSSDYGSMFRANRGRHFVLSLGEVENFYRVPGMEFAVPFPLIQKIFQNALRLRQFDQTAPNSTPPLAQLRETYEISDAEVYTEWSRYASDPSGVLLRREIRTALPEHLASATHRLVQIYNRSAHIAPLFGELRTQQSRGEKILIILQCTDTTMCSEEIPTTTSSPLYLELLVLRRYIALASSVEIIFDKDCPNDPLLRNTTGGPPPLQRILKAVESPYTLNRLKDSHVAYCGFLAGDGGEKADGRQLLPVWTTSLAMPETGPLCGGAAGLVLMDAAAQYAGSSSRASMDMGMNGMKESVVMFNVMNYKKNNKALFTRRGVGSYRVNTSRIVRL